MSDWGPVRRVLCVRLDSIGDVLMTTPAIRAIRAASGIEHVALLTSPAGAAIAALIPDIDETIVYEAPWMKAGASHEPADDHAMIADLAAREFDAAVLFTVFSQTPFPAAMLAYLAGIPRILAHCRERGYRLVSDAVEETGPDNGIAHEVRRQLNLVAHAGFRTADERLRLAIPYAAHARVAPLVPRDRPWAVVHPGASAASRRYPPGQFSAVLRGLASEHGWQLILIGDAGEAPLTAAIAAAAPDAIDLGGRLSLAETAALIAAAPLLIANNSGPAHIAAAVQTPVVVLYALTNPQHTPWQVPHVALSHDVDCRWCFASVCRTGHHRCLVGVPPAQVVAAALDLTAPARSAAA